MARNFLVFGLKQLRKMNAQRRALSQPDVYAIPTPTKGEVLFVPAAAMNSEPASCYNCIRYNHGKSCGIIGPWVTVKKLSYPPRPTADAKVIEYWPCCGMHEYGEPNFGLEAFCAANDPDSIGLGWINATRPGQESGGANCGGTNGGDDCDHYMTEGDDKRAEPTGFCRVLQTEVCNGDVCAQWRDDDWMTWGRAQDILKSLGAEEKVNASRSSGVDKDVR